MHWRTDALIYGQAISPNRKENNARTLNPLTPQGCLSNNARDIDAQQQPADQPQSSNTEGHPPACCRVASSTLRPRNRSLSLTHRQAGQTSCFLLSRDVWH
jgi:hypothetical protein